DDEEAQAEVILARESKLLGLVQSLECLNFLLPTEEKQGLKWLQGGGYPSLGEESSPYSSAIAAEEANSEARAKPIDHDQHHRHWEQGQHRHEHSRMEVLVPAETGQSAEEAPRTVAMSGKMAFNPGPPGKGKSLGKVKSPGVNTVVLVVKGASGPEEAHQRVEDARAVAHAPVPARVLAPQGRHGDTDHLGLGIVLQQIARPLHPNTGQGLGTEVVASTFQEKASSKRTHPRSLLPTIFPSRAITLPSAPKPNPRHSPDGRSTGAQAELTAAGSWPQGVHTARRSALHLLTYPLHPITPVLTSLCPFNCLLARGQEHQQDQQQGQVMVGKGQVGTDERSSLYRDRGLCVERSCILQAQHLQKVAGQTLSVRCQYPPKARTYEQKGWCKEVSALKCTRLIASFGPRMLAQASRFSIWHNPGSGFFTVTMTGLREEDSGHYWCRIYHASSRCVSRSMRFYLLVSPAEPLSWGPLAPFRCLLVA
ncbi:hypothetical protein E2I00_002064, partial [Balaenoptera physalus]